MVVKHCFVIMLVFVYGCYTDTPDITDKITHAAVNKEPFPFKNVKINYSIIKNSIGVFSTSSADYWNKQNSILLMTVRHGKPVLLIDINNKPVTLTCDSNDRKKMVYSNDSIKLSLILWQNNERYAKSIAYDGEAHLEYGDSIYIQKVYGICDSLSMIKYFK